MSSQGSPIYVPFPAFADWESMDLETGDFDQYSRMLFRAKAAAEPSVLAAAMEAARRYAAVDTNAIEGIYEVDRGFTRTVATQAAAWESVMEARGAHVRPAFEDAMKGYEYVLDVATGKVEITENWVRAVHATVCASQETYRVYTSAGPQTRPLPKGTYKTMPNSPTLLDGQEHAYASVVDTAPEMQRFIGELRSDRFRNAHPLLQAAYAHYAYVCIHPFADGNGRVARSLSSAFLYRSPGVPLIVFADQRNDYYDALRAADCGQLVAFVRFIAMQAIDSMNLVRALLVNTAPPAQDTIANLNALFNSGSEEAELVAAGIRLRNMALNDAIQQLKKLDLPTGLRVTSSLSRHVGGPKTPLGYDDVGEEGAWCLVARSDRPFKLHISLPIYTFFRVAPSSTAELLMCSRADDGLEVWMREIVPSANEMLKLKVTAWCEARVAEFLSLVQRELERLYAT